MDTKPLIYHPNRAALIYNRADVADAEEERLELEETNRTYRLVSALAMADPDRDAIADAAHARVGPGWNPLLEAETLEHDLRNFIYNGRQIFDFSPIARLLMHTDVGSVVPKDVPPPYEMQYLHFGDCGLPSPFPDTPVDGAYLLYHPDEEYFDFTVACAHPDPQALRTLPLETVILHHGRAGTAMADPGRPFSEGVDWQSGEDTQIWEPYLPAVARLVMNALCYLNHDTRDVEQSYQPNAPQRLVAQAQSTSPKQARRARSKLDSMGYREVHICGRRMAEAYAAIGTGSGRAPEPHWRRGHWRQQAHGPRWQARRLVWIPPTIVNRDIGEPSTGHVYRTDRESGART